MIKLKHLPLIVLSFYLLACNSNKADRNSGKGIANKLLNLAGYETSAPSIVYLPQTMDEISGIVYYPKDSSILSVNDNEGILYKFPLNKKKVLQRWPFSDGEDFEEILLHDSTFYAVQSNGNITKFKVNQNGVTKSIYKSLTTIELREFESVICDSTRNLLLLICKDCEDDSTNTTSVWGYDLVQNNMLAQPVFVIDHLSIEKQLGDTISKFKPSSAGVHPITGDYYYISAINDIIVVTDRMGNVKEASAIDKILFKQPEGICFKPNGDMLISNEFAEIGTATILLYKYHPQNKKRENEK